MKNLLFILLFGLLNIVVMGKSIDHIMLDQYRIDNHSLQVELDCRVLPYMTEHELSKDKYVLYVTFNKHGYVCISAISKRELNPEWELLGYINVDGFDLVFTGDNYNFFVTKIKTKIASKKKIQAIGTPIRDGGVQWFYLIISDTTYCEKNLKLYKFIDKW